MKGRTLLEQAKEIKVKRSYATGKITGEEIELAMAWMKDDIRLVQINKLLGYRTNTGHTLYKIACWIREGYRRGKIKEL